MGRCYQSEGRAKPAALLRRQMRQRRGEISILLLRWRLGLVQEDDLRREIW